MKGAVDKTAALQAFLVAPPSWKGPHSLGGDGMIVSYNTVDMVSNVV